MRVWTGSERGRWGGVARWEGDRVWARNVGGCREHRGARSRAARVPAPPPGHHARCRRRLQDRAITVASFDFPESVLWADIYGAALRRGRATTSASGRRLGPRELVDPALVRGLVELVPEYAGTALQFMSLGVATPRPTWPRPHRRSTWTAARLGPGGARSPPRRGLQRDRRRPETASTYELRTISDLRRAQAARLRSGDPPSAPTVRSAFTDSALPTACASTGLPPARRRRTADPAAARALRRWTWR